jgi:hypothetical protein
MDKITQILESVVRCIYFEAVVLEHPQQFQGWNWMESLVDWGMRLRKKPRFRLKLYGGGNHEGILHGQFCWAGGA